MPNNPSNSDNQGTFARLYDVQQELSQRHTKPMGRPRKKVRRKPTTVHLTSAEKRSLAELKLMLDEQFTINQSELVGVAIDALNALIRSRGERMLLNDQVDNVDSFRQAIREIATL